MRRLFTALALLGGLAGFTGEVRAQQPDPDDPNAQPTSTDTTPPAAPYISDQTTALIAAVLCVVVILFAVCYPVHPKEE